MSNKKPKAKAKTPKNPRMPRARRASVRQRKYVEGVVAGKPRSRAARDAGYSKRTAEKPGRIDDKPAVEALFKELMEEAGITDRKLALKINQGLDAAIVGRETLHAA